MDQQTPNAVSDAQDGVRNYTADELKAAVLAKLTYSVGKNSVAASPRDWFLAVAFATRDIVVERWIASTNAVYQDGRKRVYYLSLEFLIGRLLYDAIANLGIVEPMTRGAVATRPRSDRTCRRLESDAALGNGGLGRLAACFMDSMATLVDRRFRLRHSLRQRPVPPDHPQRLAAGDSRGLAHATAIPGNSSGRRSTTRSVSAAGSKRSPTAKNRSATSGTPTRPSRRSAYDTPIVGWRGRHVNTLRLWSARAVDPLKLDAFNAGDYIGALSDTVRAEAISKVLYPERRDAGRPGAAAAAGIFLRFGLAARSGAAPRQAVRRRPHAARPRRGPAQRHPSVDRRRRADAHPGRPQPHRLGRGVGDRQDGVLLHQPHAAARGAGELAGAADGAAAAAPHADHLSDQRDASRRARASAASAIRRCSPPSR